ncbi:MAG: tetratricopeptide repeat protein [Microscillaceae bacterium]|nr:tetratricopeptide repeat protein [Microscillaceae bacterium]
MLKFISDHFIGFLGCIILVTASANAQTAKDYLKSGNQKYYDQQYAEAMADFKKAIDLEPTYAKAYQNLGNVMFLLQDFEGALDNFNKSIQYDNRSHEAYISRATLYFTLRKYKEALLDIDKALEINPKYSVAHELKGSIYFSLGKKEEACGLWKESATIGNEIARKKLALHCGIEIAAPNTTPLMRGAEGEGDSKTKLPENTEDLCKLGDHHMELRNYEDALDVFNKAIKQDAKCAKAYFGRGMAKFAQGDQKNACKDFQKALELGHSEAAEFIGHGCQE